MHNQQSSTVKAPLKKKVRFNLNNNLECKDLMSPQSKNIYANMENKAYRNFLQDRLQILLPSIYLRQTTKVNPASVKETKTDQLDHLPYLPSIINGNKVRVEKLNKLGCSNRDPEKWDDDNR